MKKMFQVRLMAGFAVIAALVISFGSCSDAAVDETSPDPSSELTAGPRAVGLAGPISTNTSANSIYWVNSSYGVSSNYNASWSVSPSATVIPGTYNSKYSATIKFPSSGTYNVTVTIKNKNNVFVASETIAVSVTQSIGWADINGPQLAYTGPYNPDIRPYVYTASGYPSSYTYEWTVIDPNGKTAMSLYYSEGNKLYVEDYFSIGMNTVKVTVKSAGVTVGAGDRVVSVLSTGY